MNGWRDRRWWALIGPVLGAAVAAADSVVNHVPVLLGPLLGADGVLIRRPGPAGGIAALLVPVGAAPQMVLLPPAAGSPMATPVRWTVWAAAAIGAVLALRGAGYGRVPPAFVHDGRPLGGDVEWEAFPWPDDDPCDRSDILRALRAVVEPHPRDWADGMMLVRFAVGNDHRGTVYPAAVAMTDQLLTVAEHYPGAPRARAVGVLEAWWGGYQPERGLESYVDADGVRIAVLPEMARRIAAATPLLTRIAEDGSDPTTAVWARDLLAVIPLGWGNTIGEGGRVDNWEARLRPDGTVDFTR